MIALRRSLLCVSIGIAHRYGLQFDKYHADCVIGMAKKRLGQGPAAATASKVRRLSGGAFIWMNASSVPNGGIGIG